MDSTTPTPSPADRKADILRSLSAERDARQADLVLPHLQRIRGTRPVQGDTMDGATVENALEDLFLGKDARFSRRGGQQ